MREPPHSFVPGMPDFLDLNRSDCALEEYVSIPLYIYLYISLFSWTFFSPSPEVLHQQLTAFFFHRNWGDTPQAVNRKKKNILFSFHSFSSKKRAPCFLPETFFFSDLMRSAIKTAGRTGGLGPAVERRFHFLFF
ncbi:hypothetical protein BSKO_02723 [Bryopsis sp. KO-2023]|nr:hypothetical protein BSKO_02723 [Bryopsis sp. KO-2023]